MHVDKYQKRDSKNIIAEAYRDRDFTHTESNIDPTRTHLNRDAMECLSTETIHNMINDYAKRKDAVCLLSTILTIPEEGKYWSMAKQMQFFKDALPEIMKTIGGVAVYAKVHFDETTPHMHVGIIPITLDDRLCAKELMTRKMLRDLHPNVDKVVFPKYGVHVYETDEQTRQIEHDLGMSKDTIHNYRKKQYNNQLLQEASDTIDKNLQVAQKDLQRSTRPVKHQKGEKRKDYKKRRSEWVEVRTEEYERLRAFEMQFNTIPDKNRSEEELRKIREHEASMAAEHQQHAQYIQNHREYMEQERRNLEQTIERRAEEKAEQKVKDAFAKDSRDYTERLEQFCAEIRFKDGEDALTKFKAKERELRKNISQGIEI